jgi:hypothetical protein
VSVRSWQHANAVNMMLCWTSRCCLRGLWSHKVQKCRYRKSQILTATDSLSSWDFLSFKSSSVFFNFSLNRSFSTKHSSYSWNQNMCTSNSWGYTEDLYPLAYSRQPLNWNKNSPFSTADSKNLLQRVMDRILHSLVHYIKTHFRQK